MRTIGRIEGRLTEEGVPVESDYSGGYIVQITADEANVLTLLQKAIDGHGWIPPGWPRERGGPSDMDMNPIFKLIREWAYAKFSVNDLRRMVDDLDRVLMKLEETK